ncbi:MAG: MFS transporter [Candidatus Thermoplasmatota archaeon]
MFKIFEKTSGISDSKAALALRLIILFGVISLFGDIIYEGARGINGPYLGLLGANAAIIGLIVGTGELLGYGIRLISGYISDRTRAYWLFTILGYGLICTVPMLGLTNMWSIAALFIVVERIGKALRTPSRDTLLSEVTQHVGTGFGFGLHEFIDQIGAIIGPLIFTVFFFTVNSSEKTISDYNTGYTLLWLPYILMMIIISVAYISFTKSRKMGLSTPVTKKEGEVERLSLLFYIYTFFAFVTTLGFVNFALIGYHLKMHAMLSDAEIPLFYMIAMGVDAVIALIVGRVYDRLKTTMSDKRAGMLTLIIIPVLSALIPYLAFSSSYILILGSMMLWGIVMGSHETIMRSAIADITPLKKRGIGYGLFTTSYGLALFMGGIITGVLYEYSLVMLNIFVITTELIAVLLFIVMWKNIKGRRERL